MPDILGEAYVSIVPDMSAFTGLLQQGAAAPLKALEGAFGKVGLGIAAVGAAGIGLGAVTVGMAANFESALAKIDARTGQTKDQIKSIGDAFLGTAGTVTFNATQIADAFAPVAGQLATVNHGALDASQALGFMNAAMAIAEATGGDLGSSTANLSGLLQAFQLSVSDAAGAADILFNVSNSLGLSTDDTAGAFEKLHAKLGAIGGTLPQVATLFEDLATHGLVGQRALLAVSHAADTLLSGTPAVDKAIKDLGLSLYDASGNFVGFGSVIAQLAPKLAGMSEAQRKTIEDTLLGKGAFDKLDATIMAGLPGWDAAAQAATAQGTAAAGAAAATDTFGGKLDKAKSAIHDAGIAIGEVLLPYVTKLADWLGKHIPDAIATLQGWIAQHRAEIGRWVNTIKQDLIIAFQALWGTISTVSGILSGLVGFIGQHLTVFRDLAIAISGIFTVAKIGSAATGWTQAVLGDLGKLKNYIVQDLGGAISSLFSGHPLQAIQNLFGKGANLGVGAAESALGQRVFVTNWEMIAGASKLGPGGIPTAALPAAAGAGGAELGGGALLGALPSLAELAVPLAVAAAGEVLFVGGIAIMNARQQELVDAFNANAPSIKQSILVADSQWSGAGLSSSQIASGNAFLSDAFNRGKIKTSGDLDLFTKAWAQTAQSGMDTQTDSRSLADRMATLKQQAQTNFDSFILFSKNASADLSKVDQTAAQLPGGVQKVIDAVAKLPTPTGNIHTDLDNIDALLKSPELQPSIATIGSIFHNTVPTTGQVQSEVGNLLGQVTTGAQAASLLQGGLWKSNSGIAPLPAQAGSLTGNTGTAAGAAWNLYGGFNAALGPASQLGGKIQGLLGAIASGTANAADLARRLLSIAIPSFLRPPGFQHGGVMDFGKGAPFIGHGVEAILAKDRTDPALWEAVVASIRGDRSMQRGQQVAAIASQGRATGVQQGQWQVIYNLSVNGLTADEVVPRMRQEVEQSHARLIRKLGALR